MVSPSPADFPAPSPFYIFRLTPTPIDPSNPPPHPLSHPPLYTSLLLPNTGSTARDTLAAERTFLSSLRLGIYMSIVSVAMVISFHLKLKASPLEKKVALPAGLLFWLLAMAVLAAGCVEYARGIRGFVRRSALVQSGTMTVLVFMVTALAIVAACGVFLAMRGGKAAEKEAGQAQAWMDGILV
ncbi:MAG: hypothetical protein M1814_006019 [Vezdaea aestivalis]|nr:MAG: hypothetical protein M1814_006019 [Vezdaea aestivalis]